MVEKGIKKIENASSSATIEPESKEDASSTPVILDKKTETKEETGVLKVDFKNILEQATTTAIKKSEEYIDEKFKKENIDHKIERLDDKISKIDDKQINIIETLAIFVALFTFVSLDFQVFRTYQQPQAIAGLTLILLGSILTFITILDFILNIHLPFTKVRNIVGSVDPILQMAKKIGGYKEEVEFKLFKPKNWGPGFKIKISLVVLWFLFIVVGTMLFIFSPKPEIKEAENYKIENQGSSIQIQGNTITLPESNNQNKK